MSDEEIGYTPTEKDIQTVVKWLKVHYPEDANEEYARHMLLKMRDDIREIGSFSEDLLYKMKENIDKTS